ncbi:MAG: DUF354 domain-containing protein [Candidatus Zhuqueibacterota bacterium]
MRIWIDFENTPHVLILKPIIENLENRGHQVILTARDCSQTLELAEFFHLRVTRISHHHGKNIIKKILGHISRIYYLVRFIRNQHVDVAVSHSSRSQILASAILGIPTFVMLDYEHVNLSIINRYIHRLVTPEMVTSKEIKGKVDPAKIIHYPGLKEHIYVGDLLQANHNSYQRPENSDNIIVTMRPPAADAHYHKESSTELFYEALKFFSNMDNMSIVVTARNKSQREEILAFAEREGLNGNISIPHKVYNGVSLIWNSDLVIGGGGTMNREAAVMGVPAYSIFQGKLGAVDRYLVQDGRLKIIHNMNELKSIKIQQRNRDESLLFQRNDALISFISDKILETGGMNRKSKGVNHPLN